MSEIKPVKAPRRRKVKEEPRPGPKSIYTPELGVKICDTIATSSLTMRQMCKSIDFFPPVETLYNWLRRHRDFGELFMLAKKRQVQVYIDETHDLLLERPEDPMHAAQKKMQLDFRKWYAGKLQPKVYGDKVAEESEDIRREVCDLIKDAIEKYKSEY